MPLSQNAERDDESKDWEVSDTHFSTPSPSPKLVATLDPGCVTWYGRPATGSGTIRQSCSWPQTTRSIQSSKRPSGTAGVGGWGTLPIGVEDQFEEWKDGGKRIRKNKRRDELSRTHGQEIIFAYRFWCTTRTLNQSSLSLGMYIRTRLLRSSKCMRASLTLPTPYNPRRV